MNNPGQISVIIPALNEAEHLKATLLSLQTDPAPEIIVVDGGSRDATRDIALAAGVTFLRAPRGRARQQNLGAAAASGEILFFLHADTQAPPDYAHNIRQAMLSPHVGAGAFSLGNYRLQPRSNCHHPDRQPAVPVATAALWRSGLIPAGPPLLPLGGLSGTTHHGRLRPGPKSATLGPGHHPPPNRAHLRPPLAAPGPLAHHVHQPTDDFRLLLRSGPGHPGSHLSSKTP